MNESKGQPILQVVEDQKDKQYECTGVGLSEAETEHEEQDRIELIQPSGRLSNANPNDMHEVTELFAKIRQNRF